MQMISQFVHDREGVAIILKYQCFEDCLENIDTFVLNQSSSQ